MDEPRSVFAAFTRGTHALGITLIGLGALAALAPAVAGAPVVIVVRGLVALAGAVLAVFGWRAWSGGKGPLGLLAGGLAAACGLALVFSPMSTLDTVSSLVAAYMIVAGASALLFSSRLDDDAGRTWALGERGRLDRARRVDVGGLAALGAPRARTAARVEARFGGRGGAACRAGHAAPRCGRGGVPRAPRGLGMCGWHGDRNCYG